MQSTFINVIQLLTFYIILNRRREQKKNKQTSRQSLSEEQNSHKNVQKQNKWPEKDSIDDNMKQAHDRKKIDSHKDTRKSEGPERYAIIY